MVIIISRVICDLINICKEFIDFDVNPDSDLIVTVVQIPVKWEQNGNFILHENPEKQWELITQTLEEIKKAKFNGRTTDIALFPELSIPHKYIFELKRLVEDFNSNIIILAGFDNIPLEEFVELLDGSDNTKKKEQISKINQSSDYEYIKKTKPVNFCSIIVKSDKSTKQYFQSKIYPSVYEQTGSRDSEVLHGKYLLYFETKLKNKIREKRRMRRFSFVPLICFDQIYEKLEAGESIIRKLITHAENEEAPGFIFILQYNPRMDHISIDEALYEYYLCLPTRSLRTLTYTLFANVSDKSKIPNDVKKNPNFGSLIVFNKKARFTNTTEHKLIKMGRGNLHNMEFVNTSDRLYFLKCSLLFNYREEARSSRNPIEIMQIKEYRNNLWESLLPKKVIDPIEVVLDDFVYPTLDRYCTGEFIKKFDDGILKNEEVNDEISKNELLIVLRRGYETIRKEQIPKKLIEKLKQILKRLDMLDDAKKRKLLSTTDDNIRDELSDIGSNLQKNKKIIECIVIRSGDEVY